MANFSKIFQKKTNFLGISNGSSSIFAGNGPKSAEFSNFSRLHALCGINLVKMGSKNGKIAKKRKRKLIFETCFLKRTRAFWQKVWNLQVVAKRFGKLAFGNGSSWKNSSKMLINPAKLKLLNSKALKLRYFNKKFEESA